MAAQNNQNGPLMVSGAAQNALDKLLSVDPVLAPLTLATISALANTVSSGISVNGMV